MSGMPGRLLGRREFIAGAGATVLAGAAGCTQALERRPAPAGGAGAPPSALGGLRGLFDLEPGLAHLSAFVLAPHPRPVREAIERHRRGLDRDPRGYLAEHGGLEDGVRFAAAEYLGAAADEIALTDSTTMGLGLLYGGLRLSEGQEVVTTEHDFYATHEALRLRAERTGATVRRVRLYGELGSVSEDEIVDAVRGAVGPRTRVVAVTWVHSSTGLKLPIRRIADALEEVNARRDEGDRVLLCVDGVHGVGVEDAGVADLGCDFLVSGCHKWLFGPRGTGVVWGRASAWAAASATIPTFDGRSYAAWIRAAPPGDVPPGPAMTPGGYHSFEHRWALAEAFRLHLETGRRRVAGHTHGLALRLKEGLAGVRGVRLRTPTAEGLSAGIVCFEVEGSGAQEVVARLRAESGVVATVTPYATRYVRLGPSIANTAEDVDRAVMAVAGLAG